MTPVAGQLEASLWALGWGGGMLLSGKPTQWTPHCSPQDTWDMEHVTFHSVDNMRAPMSGYLLNICRA